MHRHQIKWCNCQKIWKHLVSSLHKTSASSPQKWWQVHRICLAHLCVLGIKDVPQPVNIHSLMPCVNICIRQWPYHNLHKYHKTSWILHMMDSPKQYTLQDLLSQRYWRQLQELALLWPDGVRTLLDVLTSVFSLHLDMHKCNIIISILNS